MSLDKFRAIVSQSVCHSQYFHSSLLFEGKAKSETLEWSHTRGLTLVGSNLPCKYNIWVEVSESGKHSSFLL